MKKHDWHPACQLLETSTATYLVCKSCGIILRADEANKDKPCKGPVKITVRKHGNTKSGSRGR
jgi:hypothetical protein